MDTKRLPHQNLALEISLQVVCTFHTEIPLNMSEDLTHGTRKKKKWFHGKK